MANMALKKNEMPLRPPPERSRDFSEVALGYTESQALDEARRCLGCKNKPCAAACPVAVDIPGFIGNIAAGDFEGAYTVITARNSLPAICGRVCPQETQCEGSCVRTRKGEAVAIGRLERFAADYHLVRKHAGAGRPLFRGHRVAVIGSGPAGLACAGSLVKKGYGVTIFEALHLEGGVLVYGIPEFRLPKAIVRREIQGLKDLGVEIATNVVIGKTLSVDELLETQGFDAVFAGSGAGLPKFMNIPGENLKGVYSANEFLTRINLMKAYTPESATPIHRGKRAAVVGGGNVAMDAARCARRLGADVVILYRRTERELPARLEEVEHAKEEGILFMFLTNPVGIGSNDQGWVDSITCQKMVLSQPDESGRARPEPLAGSEFRLEADTVIMAIGTSPNPLIKSTTSGLDTHRWGGIITDETGKTSREGVWAGGDAVTGAATVILAMGAGKNAAEAIDAYCRGKS
ncbi:MAG: NADPH-dependent glutamate synthase [Spirochaetaceae bacterium]|jgi:glutamate synthase (NADPH/NADH) small chain|nr:NADPH-dependent glutamate synthase [Spirochaetaceae bacterium]